MKKKKNIFDYSLEDLRRLTPTQWQKFNEELEQECLRQRETVKKQLALIKGLARIEVSYKTIAKVELGSFKKVSSGDLQKWNSQPETELFSSTDETYILPVSRFVRVIPFLFCFGNSYFSVNRLN